METATAALLSSLSTDNLMKIIDADNNTFRKACNSNNLKVAQCLYSIANLSDHLDNNKIDCEEDVFYDACNLGHLEVAQWLFSIKPTIDISAHNEEAFRVACLHGDLKMAQWLLSVKPTIDISIPVRDTNTDTSQIQTAASTFAKSNRCCFLIVSPRELNIKK